MAKSIQNRRFHASPESFRSETIILSDEESLHALKVLRLSIGDEVNLFDGKGREFLAVISDIKGKRLFLQLGKSIETSTESPLHITLASALIKMEQFEWMIQKAVEIGVNKIIPLVTDYTENNLVKQCSPARYERWNRIIINATKQCERSYLMEVDFVQSFSETLSNQSQKNCINLMFVERESSLLTPMIEPITTQPQKVFALIGPEGGWSDSELQSIKNCNIVKATLGPRILRAETAAIAAATLIQQKWGDLF